MYLFSVCLVLKYTCTCTCRLLYIYYYMYTIVCLQCISVVVGTSFRLGGGGGGLFSQTPGLGGVSMGGASIGSSFSTPLLSQTSTGTTSSGLRLGTGGGMGIGMGGGGTGIGLGGGLGVGGLGGEYLLYHAVLIQYYYTSTVLMHNCTVQYLYHCTCSTYSVLLYKYCINA